MAGSEDLWRQDPASGRGLDFKLGLEGWVGDSQGQGGLFTNILVLLGSW